MDQEIKEPIKPPNKGGDVWIIARFAIPPILVLVVGMPLYLLCVLIGGGGHGLTLPFALLFPFAFKMKDAGMVGIQLLIYGIVLGIANAARVLRKTAWRLLLFHGAVVLLMFFVWLAKGLMAL